MIVKYIASNQTDAHVIDPYKWVDEKEILLHC